MWGQPRSTVGRAQFDSAFCNKEAAQRRAAYKEAVIVPYGTICEILVPQFASCVRVFPHLKLVVKNVLNVQVWLMYSEAIQMELPSVAAAP
jgi:hypothetical protein